MTGLDCRFQDQKMVEKWSDFDETLYLESTHSKPKTHQILLKSDNYSFKNVSFQIRKIVRFQ